MPPLHACVFKQFIKSSNVPACIPHPNTVIETWPRSEGKDLTFGFGVLRQALGTTHNMQMTNDTSFSVSASPSLSLS